MRTVGTRSLVLSHLHRAGVWHSISSSENHPFATWKTTSRRPRIVSLLRLLSTPPTPSNDCSDGTNNRTAHTSRGPTDDGPAFANVRRRNNTNCNCCPHRHHHNDEYRNPTPLLLLGVHHLPFISVVRQTHSENVAQRNAQILAGAISRRLRCYRNLLACYRLIRPHANDISRASADFPVV